MTALSLWLNWTSLIKLKPSRISLPASCKRSNKSLQVIKGANREEDSETLWISPLTSLSLKIYVSTLGKLPSPNFNLQFVRKLPFILVNPLLQKFDLVNFVLVPFSCTIFVTLWLLLAKIRILSATQVVQVMEIVSILSAWATCTVAKLHASKNVFVYQHNAIFQSNPTRKYRNTHLKESILDLPGLALLVLITIFSSAFAPLGIGLAYIGAGPVHAIIENIFGQHSNIYTKLFDSMFSAVLFVYVLAREVFMICFVAVATLVRIKNEFYALDSYPLSETDLVCCRYIFLRRQYLRISEAYSLITECTVLCTQTVLCIILWMLVVGHKLIPGYLVAVYIGLFICVLGIMLTGLQLQGSCRVLGENLIKKHAGGFHVYGIRGGDKGYIKRMWTCQRPLTVYCGKHFVIGKDAIMNYLDVLSSNATNLLVLLKI